MDLTRSFAVAARSHRAPAVRTALIRVVESLRRAVPVVFGLVILHQLGAALDPVLEALAAAVPAQTPEIVSSAHREGRSGSVSGRLLVVAGSDGYGRPYETEVLVFQDKRSYKATHAVFWSEEKFSP